MSSCQCPPTQDWCDCPTSSAAFRIFVGVGVAVWFFVFFGLMFCWYQRRRTLTRRNQVVADLNASFVPHHPLEREETLPLYTTKSVDPPLYQASPNRSVESFHASYSTPDALRPGPNQA